MTQKSTDLRSETPQGVADIFGTWEDDREAPMIPGLPIPRPRREQFAAVAA